MEGGQIPMVIRLAPGSAGPVRAAVDHTHCLSDLVRRMPRRVVRELLEQVLAIPLSPGSLQNSWDEASEAVAEPCAELER